MNAFEPKQYAASIRSKTLKVTTWRSTLRRQVVQHHRGFEGLILVRGQRNALTCGHFHQKAKAARACAEKQVRYLERQANEEQYHDGGVRPVDGGFQADCECGWQGKVWPTPEQAVDEQEAHAS